MPLRDNYQSSSEPRQPGRGHPAPGGIAGVKEMGCVRGHTHQISAAMSASQEYQRRGEKERQNQTMHQAAAGCKRQAVASLQQGRIEPAWFHARQCWIWWKIFDFWG